MVRVVQTASKPKVSPIERLGASKLVCWTGLRFGERLVMSTSFGIQSAVTLHLVNRVMPGIPVIWVDTGYLPDETYDYAELLRRCMNLNLHVARAKMSPTEMEAQHGCLWESENVDDLDLYDRIRKVEPMQDMLEELRAEAWISGLRSEQTRFRSGLAPLRKTNGMWRIYPILNWTSEQVADYLKRHRLPRHPLQAKGYTTVGDVHSSRPQCEFDSNERDTRFRGIKQECGLHYP